MRLSRNSTKRQQTDEMSLNQPKLHHSGKRIQKKYKEQLLLDGAYTELKRAQDALTKSMKVKRKEIEDRLRSGDDHAEDTS